MAGRLGVQVSSLIRLAIVARFLPPSEFGLMAIVLLLLQVLEAFTTPGFNQALIQRQGKIEFLFPSVYTLNVFRGFALGAIILLSAPFVASFFGQPESVSIIRTAAIIVVVRGLQSPAIATVHRELRYKSHFFWDFSSTGGALVSALVFLMFTQDVWVLLVALIAEETVRTVGSYVIAPWRPQFQVVWGDVLELNRFGRWVVVGSVVVFLSLQLDSIVIGRLLEPESLGVYQIAMRISQLPATQISQVVATVAFPTLSRLYGQDDRVRSAYLRMFSGLTLLNVVVSGTMILLAEPMIFHLFGSQWGAAVPVVRILALAGFVRSLVTVGGKVFYAAGRPKYDSIMNATRLAVFAVIIVPMVKGYGITGAATAVLISISAVFPAYLVMIHKTLGVGPLEHLTGIRSSISYFHTRVGGVSNEPR